MTFLGWTVSAPRLNAVYEPAGGMDWTQSWTWNPQWQTNDPVNDPEPPDGADLSDVDTDGLPAWVEEWYGILRACPVNMAGNPDCDGDGATDGEELQLMGTDPLNAYSCGAHRPDNTPINDLEWWTLSITDTDGDGLNDLEEICTWQTDPADSDSDDDEWNDGAEAAHGTGVTPDPSSPTDADSDNDGLTDLVDELLAHQPLGDWDGDGLGNQAEQYAHGTSMLRGDTDEDGLGDGYELKTLSQRGEAKAASDPNNSDSDGDGVFDGEDEDCWFPTEWAHRNWGQPLEITGPETLSAGVAGELYTSPEFTAVGNDGNCVWELVPGSDLDGSMAFNGNYLTGSIWAGVHNFTVRVTDAAGYTAERELQLVMAPGIDPLEFTSPAWIGSYAEGQAWVFQFDATGGDGAVTFSAPDGLPDQMNLTAAGSLQGSISSTGTYEFTVTATDALGAEVSQMFTVSITPEGQLAIVTTQLGDVYPNQSYFVQIEALGGTGACQWSFDSSQLPDGLFSSASDRVLMIYGTLAPSVQFGGYGIHVEITDAAGQSAAADFMLNVTDPPPPEISITGPTSIDLSIFTGASESFQATGGSGTYSWQVVDSGGLPGTVEIDPITGSFSVVAEGGGAWPVVVAATDGGLTNQWTTWVYATDRDADGDDLLASQEHEVSLSTGIAMDDSSPVSNGRGTTDWLIYYQAVLQSGDAAFDEDADGLGPLLEEKLGTDPTLADSDGDFRPDWWVWYQSYWQWIETDDADGDELGAILETMFLGTSDTLVDSDGDNLSDASEWAYFDYSDPYLNDTDGDGLDDGSEAANFTQARFRDTDGDMLTDGEEVLGAFGGIILNPLLQDTDADGVPDYAEVDLADTDEGGIPDRLEEHWGLDPAIPSDELDDADGDEVTNLAAYQSGIDIRANFAPQFDPDGDRITTVFEMDVGLDPADRKDGADDPDGDFLTNTEEFNGHFLPTAVQTHPYQALTGGLPLRHIPDRDDPTGALVRDGSNQPVMRPAANDYEWQRRSELFMHPVCKDGIQRDLTLNNGSLDPARQYDDDWDLDGASNLNELFPPGGGRPSDPRVWNAPPVIDPSIPTAFVDQSYWHRMTGTGGQGPFVFQITEGALPPGMDLAASGIITGVSLAVGDYPFTVQLTDALGRTVSEALTLTVSSRFRFTTPENLGVHRAGGFGTQLTVTDAPSGPVVFSSENLPPTVSLDAEGNLSVDGSQPGGYSFTVLATDASTPPETTSRQFGISFAPSVTLSYPPPESRDVYVGNAISITPAASGHWPLAFTASGLPPGLQIHPTTGVISGTVTTPGSYHTVTSVTDSLPGATQTQQTGLTFRVYGSPITITSTGIGPAAKGQAYTGQIVATGGTGALNYSATGLPAGLQINPTSGAITGTPTGFGPHAITLTVTDSQPDFPSTATTSASMTVTSTTDLQLQLGLPSSSKTGQFYVGSISGAYGLPPYTYTLISGALPHGLALNASSGIVSGNPTAAGTSEPRFRVTDSNDPPLTAEAAASIYLYDYFPLALATTQQQMQGTPQVPYSVTLSGVGGSALAPPHYAFTVTGLDGNPAGVVFDASTHTLSAADPPASSEPIYLTITVTRGEESITAERSITFASPISLMNQGALPTGRVLDAYTAQLSASGGFGPKTFSLGEGSSLPAGLQLLPSGEILGTPTIGSPDPFPLVINATDAHGKKGTGSFTLLIELPPPPQLTLIINGSDFSTVVGKPISIPVTATGGAPPLVFSDTEFTFATPGTHTATITVTDANNTMVSASTDVEVSALEISVSGHKQIVLQGSDATVTFSANDGQEEVQVVDTATPGNKTHSWTHPTVTSATATANVYVMPSYSHLPTFSGYNPDPPESIASQAPPVSGAFWQLRSISYSTGEVSVDWQETFYDWLESGSSAELQPVRTPDGGSFGSSGTRWQTSDSNVTQQEDSDPIPTFEDLEWTTGFGGASRVELPDSPSSRYIGSIERPSIEPPLRYTTSTLEALAKIQGVVKDSRSQMRLHRDPGTGDKPAITASVLILTTTTSGATTTEEVTVQTLTIAAGADVSSNTLDLTASNGETKRLLPVELYSDLNNDGQITSADSSLREAAIKTGASDDAKEKGTEYLFINDKMSNGVWDADDDGVMSYSYGSGYSTMPKPPATHKDDDDAQALKVSVGGLNTGVVWFDHPTIDKLEFFKTKECKASDKLNMTSSSPFDLSTGTLPETIYMRLRDDWAGTDQEGNLRMFIGKTVNETWAELKLPLTVVRDFGAKHFFHAARDYILENNSRVCIRDHGYPFGPNPSQIFRLCVMREEATKMTAIDAKAGEHTGIEAAYCALPAVPRIPAVVINGNQCFFNAGWSEWNPLHYEHTFQQIADKCHGRVIRSSSIASISSDNFDDSTLPAEGSLLAGPDPIPVSTKAGDDGIAGTADDIPNPDAGSPGGKYIACNSGIWTFAAGRAGGVDALGGLSTNYDSKIREGSTFKVPSAHQMIGYAEGKQQGKGCIFTATQIKGGGYGTIVKGDAINSGVPALTPSTDAGAIKLFILDCGAGSLALMHIDPTGTMQNAFMGRKTKFGFPYYVNNYLALDPAPARP